MVKEKIKQYNYNVNGSSFDSIKQIWGENIKLRQQIDDLTNNPPTDIDIIKTMINNWATDLVLQRKVEENNLSAITQLEKTTNNSLTAAQIKRRITNINKAIGKLAKKIAKLPRENKYIQKQSTGSPQTFYDLLISLNIDLSSHQKQIKDSPLDLRQGITNSYNDKDLDTFLVLVDSYIDLLKIDLNESTKHRIGYKIFHDCIEELEREEVEERLRSERKAIERFINVERTT